MHQSRRLQGLAGLFLNEALCGKLAQLVVHERQELRRGLGVALRDGREDASDSAHGSYPTRGLGGRGILTRRIGWSLAAGEQWGGYFRGEPKMPVHELVSWAGSEKGSDPSHPRA